MSELFNIETALRAGALSGTVIFVLILLARKMKICSINYLILIGSVFTGKKDSDRNDRIHDTSGCMYHIRNCLCCRVFTSPVFRVVSGDNPGICTSGYIQYNPFSGCTRKAIITKRTVALLRTSPSRLQRSNLCCTSFCVWHYKRNPLSYNLREG